MAFVDGSIRILSIKVSDVWTPIGCLTSNNISESSETIVTTTRDNAGWATIRPVTQSFEIGFAGLNDPDNALSYEELKSYKRDRTRIEWRIDGGVGTEVDYGKGYITQIEETADAGDLVAFSGAIQGYGKPLGIASDTPPTAPNLNIISEIGEPITAVTLVWSGSTDDVGVAGYDLRVVSSDGSTEIISVTASAGSPSVFYTYSGLQQGFNYEFNVRAVDTIGQVSPWSNKRFINVAVPTDPADQTRPMIFQDGTTVQYQDGVAAQYQ